MNTREEELADLHSYIDKVDNEVTMVLQSLQWEKKNILESTNLVTCSYDKNHRILEHKRKSHERECTLKHYGYSSKDVMLPDPVNTSSKTYVKFSEEDIEHIINNAANKDPTFRKGVACERGLVLTQERLQAVYTGDERRAIHDAVIATTPFTMDSQPFTVTPSGVEDNSNKQKTHMEWLAEQRDMKRRRTKYRVATKSKKYSQVLHEVIRNQMELYAEVQAETSKTTKTEDHDMLCSKDSTDLKMDCSKRQKDLFNVSRQEKNGDVTPYVKTEVDDREKQYYKRERKRRMSVESSSYNSSEKYMKCDKERYHEHKEKRSERCSDKYRSKEKHHSTNRDYEKYKYYDDKRSKNRETRIESPRGKDKERDKVSHEKSYSKYDRYERKIRHQS